MYRISKQILAIGLPIATVAATGAAIAYWTSNGTATGDATTADPATFVVAQTAAPELMGPGVPAGGISVSVTNPGPGSVSVSQVVVSIDSVVRATGAVGDCTAADYTLGGTTTMVNGAGLLAPSASTSFSGATLVFNNSASVNQDGCKGATVKLNYVAS